MSKELSVAKKAAAPVGEAERAYGRATTRIQVASAVWALWDRIREDHGVDQQWLADRMGKNKSWVSRLLKGPGNWTLDTVADLLEAMGGRVTLVEAHTYDEIAHGKAARTSSRSSSRLIVRIEAEIELFDDVERSDAGELKWMPSVRTDAFAPLISRTERVEAA